MNGETMGILDYLASQPEVIWLSALTGAVCVIGLADFAKCWIKGKKAVKWIVLLCSLFVAYILSPLVPAVVTAVIIMWLLILAIATIARNAVVDGLPALVSRAIGSIKEK